MQQAAFDTAKIPARYVPFELPPHKLAQGIRLLRRLQVQGLNITVPFKETMLPLLDAVDPLARQLGAVNTVVRRGHRLIGYNTDVAGFCDALPRGLNLHRGPSLVLGAGGAARAVVWGLTRRGARVLVVANRTRTRALRLARWAQRVIPRARVTVLAWSAAGSWLQAHRPALIVNTTSLGLHPRDPLPVPLRHLHRPTVVYDLAYRRPTTTFVARARHRGLLALDGRHMLLYQGARAFTRWTRRRAPVAAMQRALARAMGAT